MISVTEISKTFVDGAQKTNVLRDVSFHVKRSEIYTLLGPSGSGKTTSMRCVAGLETPDTGTIELNGTTVFCSKKSINVGPNRRHLGMVFQSYAVWPHMTVAENVVYPLHRSQLPKEDRKKKVERALDLVGLRHLADRPAPNLSGGQQQRVALARAIVSEPQIIILDEPLSNLDAKLRQQMRSELLSLQKQLGLTMLYVTHDQEEALSMSTTLGVMRNAQIIEEGKPLLLFERPQTRFAAEFLGFSNFVSGTVLSSQEGKSIIKTAFGTFAGMQRLGDGTAAELFFRPHNVSLCEPSEEIGFGSGDVCERVFLGEMVEVTLRKDAETVKLRLHPSQSPSLGSRVCFCVKSDAALIFAP